VTSNELDEAAAAALARAMYKAWPARMAGKAAPGWADVLLVALRADPEGRRAVVAALVDETEAHDPPLRLPRDNPDVETEL
jgi:hypothetical protein